MDKIEIYKYEGSKPALLIMLGINGEKIYWIIQNSLELKNTGKKLAFECDFETLNEKKEFELYGEGKISVEYRKERKIKFTTNGITGISGSYIFYIPSWGYHTQKKIWVLIPVLKK